MIDPPRPPSMIFWAPAITVFQVPVTLTSITSRTTQLIFSMAVYVRAAMCGVSSTLSNPSSG